MALLTSLVFFCTRALLSCLPYLILNWPLKKIAALISIGVGAVYLLLSGASVATERAYIMAFNIFAAVLLEWRAVTLQALSIAAILVLLLRPEALLGPGFQIFFAATALLIIVFNGMSQWTRVARWLRGATYVMGSVVSAAAAVAGYCTDCGGTFQHSAALWDLGKCDRVSKNGICGHAQCDFGGRIRSLWR